MADEGPARRGLRRDIMTLHAMVLVMGGMVLLLLLALSQISSSMDLTYFLGFTLAAVGLAIVAGSVFTVSMPYLALGAALQFVGSALSAVGILKLDDIISILIVMAMPPLAFGQYQVGACVLTIKGFMEAEGADYGPALTDLMDHMLQSVRTLSWLTLAGFGGAVVLMLFIAIFQDALSLNSLAIMGILIVAIVTGASLMLLLKGGKVVVEEVAEGEAPKKEGEEKPPLPTGASR